MTITDYISRLRAKLAEPTTTRYSDVDLLPWINQARNDVADRLECLVGEGSADGIIEPLVDLPADCLRVIRAYITGKRLTPISPELLEEQDASWMTTTGTPNAFFQLGQALRLYPDPDAGVKLDLHYVRLPAALALPDAGATCELPPLTQPLVTARVYRLLREEVGEAQPGEVAELDARWERDVQTLRMRMHAREAKPYGQRMRSEVELG